MPVASRRKRSQSPHQAQTVCTQSLGVARRRETGSWNIILFLFRSIVPENFVGRSVNVSPDYPI